MTPDPRSPFRIDSLRSRGAVVSQIAHALSHDEAPFDTTGAWWEKLDPKFHHLSETFDLAWHDQIRVQASAAIDKVIRTGGATALSVLAAPIGFRPRELALSRQDADFYMKFVRSGEVTSFFERPREHVVVRIKNVRPAYFSPKDGVCEDLRFESPFVPRNPRLRDRWRKHPDNRYAHVRYWRHLDGPRPTIIAIHGFGAEGYAVNQWFFALPYLYEELGLDVALFNLPFHGRRHARWSPFSGWGFFAGGLSQINEAFAQGIHDFRLLMDYLQGPRGVEEIGVTGVSLGGCTTALLAATEPRLRFAIPNVPVSSLADVVFDWEPLGTIVRAGMRAINMDIVESRRILAVSTPLTWRPLLPKERLMVIGGVGDRLVPPTHSRILWDHWGRPRLHWFPGSHILHINRSEYLKEISTFLKSIGFLKDQK